MRRAVGIVIVTLGLVTWGYWLGFMSWSHSYASAEFAARETFVQLGGTILLLVGLALALTKR